MSSDIDQDSQRKKIKLDECIERNNKSFDDLPTEVIERIFKHLSSSDLITASAVCQKWCQISQLQKFRQNIVLRIQQSKIEKSNLPEKVIQKSIRKFSNLYYGDQISNYKLSKNIFLKMSNILEDLEFFKLENITLTFEELCVILGRMKNLKSLSINGCNFELGTSQRIKDEYLASIRSTMNSLNCFEFQAASITSYEKLSQITDMLLNLEIFKPGFRKSCKLYSDAITETNILCSIIEKNKSTLKELHIPTYQNKLPLSSVYQIQQLNLKHLSVDYDYYSPPATLSLDTFLQAHTNVITLIVSVKSYKKLDLDLIAQNMHQLERLEISADRKNIHNFNLLTISKFKKLKILKALKSPSPTFSNTEIANNLILKDLQIQNMDLTETDIINISEKLPNLETLALQSIALTDGGLQAIIKNLLHLRYLNLENTSNGDSQVTEYGISGYNATTHMQTGFSIKNLNNLQYLQLWGIKTISENCLVNNFKFSKIMKIFICDSDSKSSVTLPILSKIFKNCPKLEEFVLTN